MISIITAYYNRKALFVRTLESIKQAQYSFPFEFIAVDDGSKESERIEDLEKDYPFLRVLRMDPSKKWYMNPCIPFNVGIAAAKFDKVVLQNPECYHFDNILEHVNTHLKEGSYLSYGCFSLDKEATDVDDLLFNRSNIESIIQGSGHVVKEDGGLGWYNHSTFRPEALHFCTAITRTDLLDLGGFDERFASGYGYDDNELIYRIRMKKMRITFVDNCRVLHQNHYNPLSVFTDSVSDKYQRLEAKRNRLLYETVTKANKNHRAGILYTYDEAFPSDIIENALKTLSRRVLQRLRRLF